MQRNRERISVFGLGKLGALIAGCYGSRGFDVIGVDTDPRIVQQCHAGIAPVQEPGIEDLYRSCGKRLTATPHPAEAVHASGVTLIAVPTPSRPDGGYSLEYVLEACRTIGVALRDKKEYHLVVLKSTVSPGSCDQEVVPLLEKESGKHCGTDFGFCYNPEFIALGSVISNIFNPDLNLVGESDSFAGDRLIDIVSQLLSTDPPTARMNIVNAEIAKLAVNSYVTMKISFANLLGALCERLPGGNIDTVTSALGLDSRIGSKYLKGGLGYGGPCFPRDNAAMLSIARRLGVSFPLAEATDRANQAVPTRVADLIMAKAPPHGRVGILGLSYKPNTPVIEESQGILIAEILLRRAYEVIAYDPLAMNAARRLLGERVKYAESAQACVDCADVVLVATPWKEFQKLDYTRRNPSIYPIVIDCWALIDGKTAQTANIVRLGNNQTEEKRSSKVNKETKRTTDELEI